ncbi:MAG: GNAT family N-acetyltransferase [Candidatus Velthaea sp.]
MGAPAKGRLFYYFERNGDHDVIYLRQADHLDSHALARLRAASLREMGLLEPSAEAAFVARATGELATSFRADRLVAWLTYDDARPVGSCCAMFYDRLPYPDGSLHAEISGVYMMPDYRGNGYAAELTREVMATVRARGTRKIFLRPSKRAVPLYERLGFIADTSDTMTLV